MSRFNELTALVAVVEYGSFSAAAERLDIAKSAVSRRVTDLEARLGVRLLNRTTRRLNLTEPGRVLHERAVRLLADWDEAEQMVSANNGDHIMQACTAGLGIALLPIFIVHEGIRDGRLEVILARYQVDSVGMFLVYPPGRYLSRRVRVFSDHMVEHFQQKASWADSPLSACHGTSARVGGPL